MNRRIITGLGILILAGLAGCSSLESKLCAKDCEDKTSTINTALLEEPTAMISEEKIKSDKQTFLFDTEEPLVCLLTGAEQAERKQVLQKEIFSQVRKVEELGLGYLFYFKYEEQFVMKMTDYVIAENNCCPFLTFDIKLHSKDDVMLKISGSSEEAKKMIAMVLIDGE